MRASVTSLSKKLISTFFAATLAVGLVPAAAFADIDDASDESTGAISAESPEGDATVIPAGEIINQVEPLQVVAQQESTKSYFLAQTLEDTRTVPVVSANLPLDTGAVEDAATGGGIETPDPETTEQAPVIAIGSVVVGSFEQEGIVYAIEPGGDSVAVVASDYAKLPSGIVESHTLNIPFMVSSDSIDYYSVARIADGAFAGLVSMTGSQQAQAANKDAFVDTDSTSAAPDGSDASEDGTISKMSSVDIVSAVVELADEADSEQAGDIDDAEAITTLVIPASVTTIEDDAFAGFATLRYIVVSPDNTNYSSYDGCLYAADQQSLLLIPEGRTGAVRIAPSVTIDDSEVFSHCPSGVTLVTDAGGAASAALGDVEMRNADSDAMGVIGSNSSDELLDESSAAIRYAAAYMPTRPNVYYGSTMYRYYINDNSGYNSGVDQSESPYTPILVASTVKLESAALKMNGLASNDATKPRTYYVGVNTNGSTSVGGVYNAWAVTTNSSGVKSGQWLSSSGLNVGSYSALDVYLNDSGFFYIYFNANGGTCSDKEYAVCPYDLTVTFPTPSREGYIFTGWFTDPNGGVRVTQVGASGGTYYAHWVKKTPKANFYCSTPLYRWTYNHSSGAVSSKAGNPIGSPYVPDPIATSLKLVSGNVEMTGIVLDNLLPYTYHVGTSCSGESAVAGVESAWLVGTTATGSKVGKAIGSSEVSVTEYEAIAIYINGSGSFGISFNSNGGNENTQTVSGVMPYGPWTAPTASRSGYVISGWYDGPGDGAKLVCSANGAGPALSGSTTLYAHWIKDTPKANFYSSTPLYRWIYSNASGTVSYKAGNPIGSPYEPDSVATSLKLVSGNVEMTGPNLDDMLSYSYHVGTSCSGESAVAGVESAWLIGTTASGSKVGKAIGSSEVSVTEYEAIAIYLNGTGSFRISFDSNGGSEDIQMVNGVMPYGPWTAPAATRSGYVITGWYDGAGEDAKFVCAANEAGPALAGATTLFAHWAPVLSVSVPLSVSTLVDLVDIAEQVPVLDKDGYQGYIESHSGGTLEVRQVDFEPFEGAEQMFGDDKGKVFLEARVQSSTSTSPDLRFGLNAAASEADATKLAPFSLTGLNARKAITYRFDIPKDVLLSIDSSAFQGKTTPIGRVAYTVAISEQ